MSKKDEKLSNFLPINRKLFSHWLWTEKRSYSNAEAFLWLIKEARFEAAVATELIGGKMVHWNRGELPASLRYLADSWGWEKNRVDRFLKILEKEKMISRRLDQGQTIIRLINYDAHNGKKQDLGQQTGQVKEPQVSVSAESWDSKRDSDGTATGQRRDKTNIVNKEEEGKESRGTATHPAPTEEEQKLFSGFQLWITQNAPRVAQMKEPFTIREFIKLRATTDKEKVKDLLMQMHNWEPLLRKNRSAYLTIKKWVKLDDNRNNNNPTNNRTDDEYKRNRQLEEEKAKAKYSA
jgi:hypothetical protein